MYKCTRCGNAEHFIERNVVETAVEQNEKGEIISTSDKFMRCEEVLCGKCEVSSWYGYIVNDEGETIK